MSFVIQTIDMKFKSHKIVALRAVSLNEELDDSGKEETWTNFEF